MASRVIGLDIGATRVRAAEVELSSRGPAAGGTLVTIGSIPLRPGAVDDGDVLDVDAVAAAVKQLVSKGGFSSKRVVVGVGNQRTVVREMEVPELPMDQLRKALPFQVSEMLPMSADEALLDFYPTAQVQGESGTFLRGIMVAAAKASVTNSVMAVEGAGLRPVGVDLKAFAMMRAQMQPDWERASVAFVDIGAVTTNVVVAAEGRPRLVRVLSIGGQNVTDAVAAALQISPLEAEELKARVGLAGEIAPQYQGARDAIAGATKSLIEAVRNTFVYYQGNNPGAGIQHVAISGGAAHLPGLGQLLASSVRLPVSFGDGTQRVTLSKRARNDVRGQESLIATVVGLGLSEVAP